MIPDCIKIECIDMLSRHFGALIKIKDQSPVWGGDINLAYKISTNEGDFFIKWNFAEKYPKMFDCEVYGLKLLKAVNPSLIPEIIGYSEINEYSFMVLEFVLPGKQKANFWEDFGIKLSELHKNTSDSFGLDQDNYIGSLNQSNIKHQNWGRFFMEERIEPMIKLARDSNRISCAITSLFDNFYTRIDEIFPKELPALLHGDLWNGNFLTAGNGYACLIDPAVYYGHREIDIAMTKLFGGFDAAFYDSYNEEYPMEKGWQKRLDFYNLYPLMVHTNLFGGGYIQSVESILRRI